MGLPRLRDLPWRRTRDPWAMLVSEVMLQQTQAAARGPEVGGVPVALPDARGVRRRAARRRAAAVAGPRLPAAGTQPPRRGHARSLRLGEFPSTLDGLLALPGVGATPLARCWRSPSRRDVAVVDTNIARVLARVAGRRLTAKRGCRPLPMRALPGGESWAWNQCLMDLGAVLCRPVAPRCDVCPLQTDARGVASGDDPAHRFGRRQHDVRPGSTAVTGRPAAADESTGGWPGVGATGCAAVMRSRRDSERRD